MNHKIEVLPVGSRRDDRFVVVIDGRETDGQYSHADAMKIADFLRNNIVKLEGIL